MQRYFYLIQIKIRKYYHLKTLVHQFNIMIRKLTSWACILALSIATYAQNEASSTAIEGTVQCRGEKVPYLNITIEGTTLGTITDANGHFQIHSIPLNEFTLSVGGLGYKTTRQSVIAKPGKTISLSLAVEEDILNMEQVVVSANRNQTNRKEAPIVVTSLSPQLFEITQSANIADGLNFTPGLRTETNCQNCGFTQLRMNGMEGAYTQILMNSRPVFNGLAGVYGLEMIPANMIERLEIVRGGGSTLFGGNAIAGTINIITKETLNNSFKIDNRMGVIGVGNAQGGNPAYNSQWSANASVISEDQKTGGYVYTMLRNRDAYDANDDAYSEMVEIKNTTLGFNVFHKPGAKSKLSMDGYRIDEYRRGGNKLDYLPHEADVAEQLNHLITGLNVAYELYAHKNADKFTVYAAAQDILRDSYYGGEQDPNAYGTTTDLSSSVGMNYQINRKHVLFPESSTLIGVINSNNILNDIKLGANGSTNTTLTHQYVNTLGSFVQQDWKSNKVNLSAGIRYDYYRVEDLNPGENSNSTIDNTVFVPRFSMMYKLNPSIRFRAGYAKGYRAPQVFNEDLHIDLVNATRVRTMNANGLKQETSHSLTTSFNSDFTLNQSPCNLLIEGFYTRLDNPFSDEFYDPNGDGQFVYLRSNAQDGALVQGINLEFKTYLTRKIETQLGYTLQRSTFEKAQAWGDEPTSVSTDFVRTPNHYGYAIVNWKPNHHFNSNLSLNYTGAMMVPHFGLSQQEYDDALNNNRIRANDVIVGERLEQSKNFVTLDLKVSYHVELSNKHQTKLQVYAGVKNLFNQYQADFDSGRYRDAGYIYGPRQPRTVNIGVSLGTR